MQEIHGPPKPTLVPRAKSYSDFHELGDAKGSEKLRDVFELPVSSNQQVPFMAGYEDFEEELLDASQEEYRYGWKILEYMCGWLY